MSTPALSILVPTCDRPGPLAGCLRTVVGQDLPELEIIVSDNAGGPETGKVLDRFDDPRIRRFRREQRLGMPEHFEFILSQAKGEWVGFLGDDDALLPGGARLLMETIESNQVDAVCTSRCTYQWPEALGRSEGRLQVPHARDDELVDSRKAITEVMRGDRGYGSLPWIYTGGFVRRSVLEEIRSRMGRYFSSMSLDAYSGLAVASVRSRYLWSGEPVAIEGTCAASNGMLWRKWRKIRTSEMPFFRETAMPFHPRLGDGNVYSMPLLVYEAFLQSEPLRDFEVDTDLERQLVQALSIPKRKTRKAVADYCRTVAENNGLDFDELQRRARWPRLRIRAEKRLKKMLGGLGMMKPHWAHRIDSAEVGDVYQAARVAHRLLGRPHFDGW